MLAIVGIPVLLVGAMAILFTVIEGHEEPPLKGTIAVVDPSGDTIDAARVEFSPKRIVHEQLRRAEQIQSVVEEFGTLSTPQPPAGGMVRMGMGKGIVKIEIEGVTDTDDATVDALRARVLSGDLVALAIITEAVLEVPDPNAKARDRARFELLVPEGIDNDHTSFIEDRIGEAVVRVRAKRAGHDPDAMLAILKRPRSTTRTILEGGVEREESGKLREIRALIIPMAFMMLLWIAVFTSSQHLMMSTIEEKSNRVMEVLLSAVSPFQLMAGKIIGHGLVGLLIMSIYSGLAIISLVAFTMMHVIDLSDLAFLFVFFIMAYFMIASIMAAVGSAVTDIREANTLIMPVMIVVMIPLMLWMPISQAPNGTLATVCSYIPPAIPFVMILRVASDEGVKPLWEIPLTIVWGFACVLGMVWMAAKVFRVGVLMYGKPPSPLQLLKWLRYA
ncbi:MAG: ABC transporter permease [Planctomycetes bacterium]|nr:ABC transporter permease [Planctomycetota bacterium]